MMSLMRIYYKTVLTLFILLSFSLLFGCGFHLRGAFNIPTAIQQLKILPDEPYEPFQRILRNTFKQNGIIVFESSCNNDCLPTLQLCNLNFTEKPVAYGSDVQVNRATLRFSFSYEIVGPNGDVLIPKRCIEVERDLTIVPTAVLGTESERNHVKTELYNDAATLLIRQLSLSTLSIECQ